VTGTPVLQVVSDDQWESAETVPVAADDGQARAVVASVGRAARDTVAVELLWPGQAFVGVQWPAASWPAALAAVSRGHVAVTGRQMALGQVVEAGLLALLGAAPATDVEFVELGAVNAWLSVGPEVLWQRGDEALTAQTLVSKLAHRPDLTSSAHPVAVELAVTNPRPCWIGVYVATRSGPIHQLDYERLADVLSRVI
jgi:hypothetical protein